MPTTLEFNVKEIWILEKLFLWYYFRLHNWIVTAEHENWRHFNILDPINNWFTLVVIINCRVSIYPYWYVFVNISEIFCFHTLKVINTKLHAFFWQKIIFIRFDILYLKSQIDSTAQKLFFLYHMLVCSIQINWSTIHNSWV